MIKKKCFGFIPTKGETVDEQFKNCLLQLEKTLKSLNLDNIDILKQTIFVNAENNTRYLEIKNRLVKILDANFNSSTPPTSFVGQPPEENKHLALEIIVAEKVDGYQIQQKKVENIKYVVVQNTDMKEVYATGLTMSDLNSGISEQSQNAFNKMELILQNEGLDFNNIVRQWNYIENILDVKTSDQKLEQNYQIFNNVRSTFYGKSSFNNGYPAATGIGMNVGGVILDFIAISSSKNISIYPIKNPNQVDAHQYSEKVLVGDNAANKTRPKFERAKVVSNESVNQIFISGTAAIIGQYTINENTVSDQTIATLQNINKLISIDNLKAHGVSIRDSLKGPSYLRVYVKNKNDIPLVKNLCNEFYKEIPTLFLVSDICRNNLTVEIEGIADF